MNRIHAVTALVTLTQMSFGGPANAGPPNQADVDVCNQEAAAASGDRASAPASPVKPAQPEQNGSASERAGAEQAQADRSTAAQSGAPSAAARQAFAACLARHGYYKGYYHH